MTAAVRVLLAMLFALVVVLQTFSMPGQFAYMAEQSSDRAFLRWPLTALAVFCLLCVEVVIVSTWALLTRAQQRRILSASSFRWVDAIVAAIGAGWPVLAGVLVAVGLTADDPGLPLLLLVVTVAVALVGLLVLVLRVLQQQATQLRLDLDEVIGWPLSCASTSSWPVAR